MSHLNKAMVVLSGGQDSTTCLYWAIHNNNFDEVHAVTFDYNQKHKREIEAAVTIAKMAGVTSHEVVELGPILKGRSPLTNPDESLETYNSYEEMSDIIGERTELTFVPMRNALFLTIAANRAVCIDSYNLVTGVCEADNANYPDCRGKFIKNQEDTIRTALGLDKTMKSFFIWAPLLRKTKAETVKLASTLPGCMEALAYSHTAYSGEFPPKTQDHATVLRAEGFKEAGYPDPLIVRAHKEFGFPLPETPNYDSVRNI